MRSSGQKLKATLFVTAIILAVYVVASGAQAASAWTDFYHQVTTQSKEAVCQSALALSNYVYLPFFEKTESAPDLAQLDVTNLLANGDFEDGTLSGWQASAAEPITAEAYSGDWAVRLADTNMDTAFDTIPGQTYKVTAWVKIIEQTGSDWGGFRVEVNDLDWQTLAHSGWLLTGTRGKDWFKVAVGFTAVDSRTRLEIGYRGGSARSMTTLVDDIRVFEKQPNEPPAIEVVLDPLRLTSLPAVQRYRLVGDDPDGAIEQVVWEFGDGTRALTPAGQRRVTQPGTYLATVHVVDDEGAQVTKQIGWSTPVEGSFDSFVDFDLEPEKIVSESTLRLQGQASAAVRRIHVSTDRGFVGTAAGTTSWEITVPLQPGANCLLIQAETQTGELVSDQRRVHYQPDQPFRIANLRHPAGPVEQWELFEVDFDLENSAAMHPHFPYDPNPAPGLAWLEGVSVDAYFSNDNWQTIYRRPAFWHQPYEQALKRNEAWAYPVGEPRWTVRFAPPTTGQWQYYLEAQEAQGTTRSDEESFTVIPPINPTNHGPVRVAESDSRYFEFADGTPFLGSGHNIRFTEEGFGYEASNMFDDIGPDNQHLIRWWIPGQIWGSAWQPWVSRTLDYNGIVPATGLTLERAYGFGLASIKLDETNPIMFQGFLSGHAGLRPGHTYRLLVRWRTEGVTGPAQADHPYGATVKFGGWPEPGQTGSWPALIPHVQGDTPWHVAYTDFVAEEELIPNVVLILENTTGGAAYVDEVAVYELLPDGSGGPQLLRSPQMNSHLTFDPRRGAEIDTILAEAAERGFYFKLVISEKGEFLLNHLSEHGLPDPRGGHFNAGEGSAPRRLHEYYWRHLFARFGAFRSIHSWELVNEEAPQPGNHFRLAAALAERAAADGNPHLASTSTWSGLAEEAWQAPYSESLSYVDFHAYLRATGWLEPKDELANDSARFFHEYDLAARAAGFDKPVIWGELGIDAVEGGQEPRLAEDEAGVWLHKLTWARQGPGGVYPLFWYTDHIFDNSLHHIFGAWQRFMAGIPLANGHYQAAEAEATHPRLRIFGQKDLQHGRAHLWIDNRDHTWRAVVDGSQIRSASGEVTVTLDRPGQTFAATWYDTQTGQPERVESVTADHGGLVRLTVTNLRSDTAVRIEPGQ